MPNRRRCSASRTTTNAQFCALPAEGARMAASRIRVMISCGTGSGLSRRNARAEYMASNKPISGMANPHASNAFGSLPGSAIYATSRDRCVRVGNSTSNVRSPAQPSLAASGVLSFPQDAQTTRPAPGSERSVTSSPRSRVDAATQAPMRLNIEDRSMIILRLPCALAAAGALMTTSAAQAPRSPWPAGDEIGMANTLGPTTWQRCATYLAHPQAESYELSHLRSNTMPQSPFGGPLRDRYTPTVRIA